MTKSKPFWGMGRPRLEYTRLPARIERPEPIRPAGPVTLLHLRPAEGKAIPAVKIGETVKTGQKLALYGNGDYVTSPVTGAIAALAPFPGSFGRNYTAVTIAPAPQEVFDDALSAVHRDAVPCRRRGFSGGRPRRARPAASGRYRAARQNAGGVRRRSGPARVHAAIRPRRPRT